jgi:hypothetical protein
MLLRIMVAEPLTLKVHPRCSIFLLYADNVLPDTVDNEADTRLAGVPFFSLFSVLRLVHVVRSMRRVEFPLFH